METGIGIHMHLIVQAGEGDAIPFDYIDKILKSVDEAVYASEVNDFRTIKEYIGPHELPSIVLDAAEYRIRQYKKKSSISIKAFERGCLEVAVVVGGVAVWILQTTIGETLKEAWKDSALHARIKQILVGTQHDKVMALANDCEQRIRKKLPEVKNARVALVDPVFGPGMPITKMEIRVEIIVGSDYPPPREELL